MKRLRRRKWEKASSTIDWKLVVGAEDFLARWLQRRRPDVEQAGKPGAPSLGQKGILETRARLALWISSHEPFDTKLEDLLMEIVSGRPTPPGPVVPQAIRSDARAMLALGSK